MRVFAVLFVSMMFPVISMAVSSQLVLKEYLSEYLKHDESLQVQLQKWQIAIEQQHVASDVYANAITLKPEKRTKVQNFSGTTLNDQSAWLTAEFKQKTPIGLSLLLTSAQSLSQTSETSPVKSYKKLSVQLVQKLWKDSLGSLTRLNRELAEKSVEKVAADMNLQHATSCQKGIALYVEAYKVQQKVEVLEKQHKMTERALKLSERAYKRRQVQRLDILGARADNIRVSASYRSTQIELKEKLSNLLWPLGAPQTGVVNLMEPNFSFPMGGEINFQTHPAIESKFKSVEVKMLNLESEKNNNRSEFDLGLEWAKTSGQGILNNQVLEMNEDVLSVFLKAELPLFEKSRSANREIAEIELRMAKLELQREKEDQMASSDKNLFQVENFKHQIDKSQEKIAIYREQVKIGLGFLNTGRIEFSDYQRYREQLLNENFNLVNLKSQLWNAQMQWAFDHGKLDNSCGGII